jgi:hypothetical protein
MNSEACMIELACIVVTIQTVMTGYDDGSSGRLIPVLLMLVKVA